MLRAYRNINGVPDPLSFLFILTGSNGSSTPFLINASNLKVAVQEATGIPVANWWVEEQTPKVFRVKRQQIGAISPLSLNAGYVDKFHPGGLDTYADFRINVNNILSPGKISEYVAADEKARLLVNVDEVDVPVFGQVDDPTVAVDPGTSGASMISLLKGTVQNTNETELALGRLDDPTQDVDPGVSDASLVSLLKGIVQNTNETELALGGLNDPTQDVDPGTTATSIISLLKGIVQNTRDIEITSDQISVDAGTINLSTDGVEGRLGALTGPKELNPDAANTTLNSLLRGLLQVDSDIFSKLDTDVLSVLNSIFATLGNILTEVSTPTLPDVESIDNANDLAESITYLDGGTPDQRIDSITRSSAGLGLSYTDTFNYTIIGGNYILTGRTRS